MFRCIGCVLHNENLVDASKIFHLRAEHATPAGYIQSTECKLFISECVFPVRVYQMFLGNVEGRSLSLDYDWLPWGSRGHVVETVTCHTQLAD